MNKVLFILFVFISLGAYSQVSVTAQPTVSITPSASTELDVESQNSNTGVVIPMFKSSDLNKIISPANGLLIYCIDNQKFMYNAGTTVTPIWTSVGSIPVTTDYSSISSPIEGEIVYDIRAGYKKIYFYNGSTWLYLQ